MLKFADYAYKVYQEKSFTRAAEKLFISQPSLSLCIKKLEDSLGFPIFDRSGREITLTDIGQKYISAIEEINNIKKNLKDEIDDLKKLNKGNITIGSTIFVSSNILPSILKSFQAVFPQITINILVENSSTLKKLLEKGQIDFIVDNAHNEKEKEYECYPLANEQILLAVPEKLSVNEKLAPLHIHSDIISMGENWHKNHPKVDMRWFKNEKFILLKHGNNMRQISNEIFKENDIIPNVTQEFDHLMTSISYAEAGFGICFITDSVLKYAKKLNHISLFLPNTSHSERTLFIIRKKNKYLSFATEELIKHIIDFHN
ncbi:MAG: LysR family transcriptional regulator [Clostridia bacterium]|nr:LysR family transcriptional regulator [Clostridia bacterium]